MDEYNIFEYSQFTSHKARSLPSAYFNNIFNVHGAWYPLIDSPNIIIKNNVK